jgi:hypothetical protein
MLRGGIADELVDPSYIRGGQSFQCAVIGNAYKQSAAAAVRKRHQVGRQIIGVVDVRLELST